MRIIFITLIVSGLILAGVVIPVIRILNNAPIACGNRFPNQDKELINIIQKSC